MSGIKQKLSWAKQKPLFWRNIVFAATLVVVIWLWPAPNASDIRVRLLGMVLQLVGILTAWHDLTAAARHFGKGGPLSFFVNTWKWMKIGIFGPKRSPSPHVQRATTTYSLLEGSSASRATHPRLCLSVSPPLR